MHGRQRIMSNTGQQEAKTGKRGVPRGSDKYCNYIRKSKARQRKESDEQANNNNNNSTDDGGEDDKKKENSEGKEGSREEDRK